MGGEGTESWEEGGGPTLPKGQRNGHFQLHLGTIPYHLPTIQLQRGCSLVKALASRMLECASLLGLCLSFPNYQIG